MKHYHGEMSYLTPKKGLSWRVGLIMDIYLKEVGRYFIL